MKILNSKKINDSQFLKREIESVFIELFIIQDTKTIAKILHKRGDFSGMTKADYIGFLNTFFNSTKNYRCKFSKGYALNEKITDVVLIFDYYENEIKWHSVAIHLTINNFRIQKIVDLNIFDILTEKEFNYLQLYN